MITDGALGLFWIEENVIQRRCYETDLTREQVVKTTYEAFLAMTFKTTYMHVCTSEQGRNFGRGGELY